MKLNEIIKEKRIIQKLTQAQLASCLGISTPSVNKWEKGITCPDITLLLPLARALHTDLNTLLSFQGNLTSEEIGCFINELSSYAEKATLEEVFAFAKDKIQQFPTCASLLYYSASVLHGIQVEKRNKDNEYIDMIMSYYERVCKSDDLALCEKAKEMLVHMYIQNEEYDKAEALVAQISQNHSVDVTQLKTKLYMAKGQLSEAQHVQEERVLHAGNELYGMLIRLLDISIQDKRMNDAQYIATAASECARVLDQWEYNMYLPLFEYYTKSKQKEKSVEALLSLLAASENPWNINASPLYRTIKSKENTPGFYKSMKEKIIQSALEDEETAFIKEDSQFQDYLQRQPLQEKGKS